MARPVSRSWGSESSCETGVIAMTDKPISPLRQRMIEDMTARHFAEKAQTDYIRYVKSFAAFLGRSPDTASAEELRLFQQHMTKTHVSPWVINATVVALRFFFKVTLERDDLVRRLTSVSEPRRVPIVLSPEEAARLLTAAPGVKYRAALGVAYGAGLRVSEVVALKVTDIDRERMLLRVEQGKGKRIASSCSRRNCWSCCATGDKSRSRGAGCFPGSIRSTRCRPGSYAAPFPRRRGRRGSPRACLRTLCATASPLICSNRTSISRHPSPARTRQAGNDRALYARRRQHDPRRDESAGAAQFEPGQDPGEKRRRARSARLTPASRGSSRPGGRGYLPRPWPSLA